MRYPTISETCCAIPFLGMVFQINQLSEIEKKMGVMRSHTARDCHKTPDNAEAIPDIKMELKVKVGYFKNFTRIGFLATYVAVIALSVLGCISPLVVPFIVGINCAYFIIITQRVKNVQDRYVDVC